MQRSYRNRRTTIKHERREGKEAYYTKWYIQHVERERALLGAPQGSFFDLLLEFKRFLVRFTLEYHTLPYHHYIVHINIQALELSY